MKAFTEKKNSCIFKIKYNEIEFEFELFTKEYILNELKNNILLKCSSIDIPDKRGRFSKLKEYKEKEIEGNKYYFAYIKFFAFDGNEYGIVGGKTNFFYPDIDFSKDLDTIARLFLNSNNYNWSREVVIIINNCNITDKKKEDKQIKYLEKYIQRKFNLLDS